MPRGWEYTIKQAANLCSVSTDTIKRRLRSGDLPHAHQLTDSAGTWVIPLADLVAAGFSIAGGREQPATTTSQGRHATPPSSDLQDKIQLAVAQAESAVHASYARAFQELALEAIRADRRKPANDAIGDEHQLGLPAPDPPHPA